MHRLNPLSRRSSVLSTRVTATSSISPSLFALRSFHTLRSINPSYPTIAVQQHRSGTTNVCPVHHQLQRHQPQLLIAQHRFTTATAPQATSSPPTRASRCSYTFPSSSSSCIILGVETSCDDTSLALLSTDGTVLSHATSSQWHLFDRFHGIQPSEAAREHAAKIEGVFEEVLTRARIRPEQINGVAVTAGPGLAACLKVGLSWASDFARSRDLPYVGVHHMQAHAIVASLELPPPQQLQFPFLSLLISGGHTELWLVRSLSDMTILAHTVDDAIGEAYDKAARMIGLPRVGAMSPGATLEAMASKPMSTRHVFPDLGPGMMDFSFAGVKAALQRKVFEMKVEKQRREAEPTSSSIRSSTVASSSPLSSSSPTRTSSKLSNREIQALQKSFKSELFAQSDDIDRGAIANLPALSEQEQIDLCHSFQAAMIRQLVSRVILGVRHCRVTHPHLHLDQLIIGGGVACNQAIRSELTNACREYNLNVIVPRKLHCMDNGIMIANLGMKLLQLGHQDSYDLECVTRWPVGEKITMKKIKFAEHPYDLKQVVRPKRSFNAQSKR